MQLEKVKKGKSEIEKALFKYPNVVGVGVGFKSVKGKPTSELAVTVFVTEKVDPGKLKESDRIPATITQKDGTVLLIDVVNVGKIEFTSYFGRYRPAKPGAALSVVNSMYDGSFGALATDNSDGKTVILSASHSLANFNKSLVGDAVYQPGPSHGGTAADRIGTLKRFVALNLNDGGINFVDAAIAAVDSSGDVNKNPFSTQINLKKQGAVGLLYAGSPYITIINPIARVLADLNISLPKTAVATPGMSIHKCGAATEYTQTTVSYMNATIGMTLENGNRIEWQDQIITTGGVSDAAAGDSGAIFYTTFNV